jgi:peptide chain release factor subunit 1
MDGNGCLYGTLCGNTRTVLHKFTVDLPKKHGRGGQSSVRFARLRMEKRHNYVRKVAELATQMFISNDRPNCVGLVLAGSAEFKLKLSQSDMFDPRLVAVIVKIVDVSYGSENGFNQAIELAADCLSNVKFMREKKLLTAYFSEIAKDSGKYCFGVKETLQALEMGAVEELIVWEDLSINRYVLRNKETQDEKVVHYNEFQEKNSANFKDAAGADLEVKEKTSLLEWLSSNFKGFGAKLQFITNRSQEGAQFCKGFGGIGGLLRYQLDFGTMEEPEGGSDAAGGDDAEDSTTQTGEIIEDDDGDFM